MTGLPPCQHLELSRNQFGGVYCRDQIVIRCTEDNGLEPVLTQVTP